MNTKKLFAILTLVAFMMTLLPVAAFAGTANVPDTSDRHASILKVDKNTVEADGEEDVEFTVYVRDEDNDSMPNAVVYVASERGTTDTIKKDGTAYSQNDVVVTVDDVDYTIKEFTTDANGKLEFTVVSNVAGESKIAVGLNNKVMAYLIDGDTTAAQAEIIGTETITFEATSTENIELSNLDTRSGVSNYTIPNPTGDKGEYEYGSKDIPLDANVDANGIDYYELTFEVLNGSRAPVEGETVKFSANKNDVFFNKDEVETDEIGEAKVKVYADKPGVYEIEADVNGDVAKVWLDFSASEINDIILASDVDDLIAIDEDAPDSFKIELRDAAGNKIDPDSYNFAAGDIEFEWIVEPADSDLKDDFALSSDVLVEQTGVVNFTDDDLIEITLPKLEEEGKYVLRVNIENGKYVDVEFEGREQGEIVEMTLEYDTTALRLGGISDDPTVKHIDAAGVSVNTNSNLVWSISDYRVITNDINSDKGKLCITTDDDYIGTYVVTVVDTKEDLTASTQITVGNDAVAFEVVADDELMVNKDNTIKVKMLDADGNVVGLGEVNKVEFEAYIINEPAGAYATAEATDSIKSDLEEKGITDIDVYSKVAGQVKITFVIEVTDTNGIKTYTKTETFTFGEPKPEVTYGAKNVTMFIGSTGFVKDGGAATMDQAPFIQDGRTFVPVRMVGEALGAEVEFDAATQTITLERPDMTVTMTIGSNILTKSDGEAVVSDVAPFIVPETGRTVIPFRAIAEAFGAQVEAVFAADGTVTAVTFQQ